MIAHPQVNDRRPRLNPFIFPSDTDFRFIMLIVVTIAATLLVTCKCFTGHIAHATIPLLQLTPKVRLVV